MSNSYFLNALELTQSDYNRVLMGERVGAPGDSHQDVKLGCIH